MYRVASTPRFKFLASSLNRRVSAAVAAQERTAVKTPNPVSDDTGRIDEFRDDRDTARDAATEEFSEIGTPNNEDEELFANRTARGREEALVGFASFSKALKHDKFGIPEQKAFQSLLDAIETGLNSTDPVVNRKAFEQVILGGREKLLANPLAAFSTQLIGNDSHGARMAPAPTFGSRNTAVDMVERYWMALCRDVPFDEYDKNDLTKAAIQDLNNLGFEKEFGFKVTPDTLFRGAYEGCDVGPHVSQFLLKDFEFGNQTVSQVMKFPKEGLDYMTDMDGWFEVNNGDRNLSGTDVLIEKRRMTTLRDAGQWVHVDLPLQAGLYASLILNGMLGDRAGTQISDAVPYGRTLTTSDSFGTLGIPDFSAQAALAAGYALKHAWFQKWAVHRRLRPEVYAQRLELFRSGMLGSGRESPFSDGDFRRLFRDGVDVWRESCVLDYVFKHNAAQNEANGRTAGGTWLLPMGYPEGSPTHPAYPGGHSCFVAAAATIAKAFFQDTVLPEPVMVGPKGDLEPFKGERLTVHGELNKLIANVTHFRDGAGMHWRTDGAANTQPVKVDGKLLQTGGNLLGEAMAVSMLRDVQQTYREEIGTFEFKSVSGKTIRVSPSSGGGGDKEKNRPHKNP